MSPRDSEGNQAPQLGGREVPKARASQRGPLVWLSCAPCQWGMAIDISRKSTTRCISQGQKRYALLGITPSEVQDTDCATG